MASRDPAPAFLHDLAWRGLIHTASEGIEEAFAEGPVTAYIGFDPTASSLHVGSLLPITNLARLQRYGHRPIAIAGGGTGLIGDPSGKTQERELLTLEQVAENLVGIRAQLARFLDFEAPDNAALIVDNADWLGKLNLVDFLRDVGKHVSVNVMLAREAIKTRLETREYYSFTELSYMLLQAYDFVELYRRYGCTLQMGGSDQWGNILAGADLVRRLEGGKAHALVSPLITTASGTKFGKTEAGTVWLDPERTSVYSFYQFWLNTDDRDAVPYLKYFTWLERERIDELAASAEAHPERREAQQVLADEVTRTVHGAEDLAQAKEITAILFGGGDARLSAEAILTKAHDAPSTEIPREEILAGIGLSELLFRAGIAASKGEGRRLIRQGGIYLNNERVTDEVRTVVLADALDERLLLLRKGKKQYHLVRVG